MNTYVSENPKITRVAALQFPLWYGMSKIHTVGS